MRRKPKQDENFTISDVFALKQLLPYLYQMRGRVALSLFCLMLAKLANISVPVALKNIVDSLTEPNLLLVLPLGALFAYGGLRLLNSFFSELRDALFAKVRYNTMRLVAVNLFNKLHQLDLSFHLSRKTGAITRDIERGTNSISSLLSIVIFNILPSLFEVVLVIALLFWNYQTFFASTALITVVSYLMITFLITTWRTKYRYQMNDIESQATSHAVDSLINYETVKYFNQEANESTRYNQTMKRWQNIAIKSFTSMTVLNFIQSGVIAIGVTLILIFAAQGVIDKSITLGDMIMIQTLLLQLFLPLGTLGIVYRQVKHNLIDMNNMFALIQKNTAIKDIANAKTLQLSAGSITFDHISFAYQNKQPVLDDINFHIPAKQTVAIVGHSGSGKSTLAKLLFRFYDVDCGQICIDGQAIHQVSQQSLRQAIGIVPQDVVMFNDSIFFNIAYGKPGASLEAVRQVAKIACIDDFINRLPNGYDTVIGERGLKLSGGERQRLAIARVLLKKPAIVIFDEATSALDSQTENAIQQSLRLLSGQQTTLVIAHRLSSIVNADEIIVLANGKIKEQGNHQNLLTKQGLYYQLWQLQQKHKNDEF